MKKGDVLIGHIAFFMSSTYTDLTDTPQQL